MELFVWLDANQRRLGSWSSIALVSLCALLAGCGGGDSSSPKAAATPAGTAGASGASTTRPKATGSAGGADQKTLLLSGAVSGNLAIVRTTCSPDGLNVLISGNLGSATYGLDLNTPKVGSFQFGANSQGATAALNESAGQRKWSAGIVAGSSGLMEMKADKTGSKDADFVASPGTTGTVNVKGSWSC
jgi:hypothetical protein